MFRLTSSLNMTKVCYLHFTSLSSVIEGYKEIIYFFNKLYIQVVNQASVRNSCDHLTENMYCTAMVSQVTAQPIKIRSC